jgi:hypothetical protein
VTNFAFFLIATTTLARYAAVEGDLAMWGAELVCLVFAAGYGWLLFRGPRGGGPP